MILQSMILINMLVTIVTNYFSAIRQDASRQSGESELFWMLIKKVKRAVGFYVPPEDVKAFADRRHDVSTLNEFTRRADLLARKLNKRLGGAMDMKQLSRRAKQALKEERMNDVDQVNAARATRRRLSSLMAVNAAGGAASRKPSGASPNASTATTPRY